MAARCASCSYPLSVSDSVVCYECSSYFHIDCAQLVGFPNYQLSGDPSRNTFLCATCVLLPLPTRASDSDSSSDCDMPSRQQDYPLEPHADIAQDMAEVKGAVQDLSNLCKDMLREINEIKSINLTLRCGVENLRHENEERDKIIAELKRRLDVLERGKTNFDCNQETNDHFLQQSQKYDGLLASTKLNFESSAVENTSESLVTCVETNKIHSETTTSEVKSYVTEQMKESRQDWTWKGSKAVEILDNSETHVEDESTNTEESATEEEIAHGWETLHEELESKYEIKEEMVLEAIDSATIQSSNTWLNKQSVFDESGISDDKDIIKEEEGVGQEKEYFKKELRIETETSPVKNSKEEIIEETSSKYDHEQEENLIESTFQEDREYTTSEIVENTYDIAQHHTETESTNTQLQRESASELNVKENDIEYDNINEGNEEELRGSQNTPSDDFDASKSEFEEDEEDTCDTDTNETIEEIHHEDLIEIEVGEIPEEEDNEEQIRRDEHKESFEQTEEEDGYRSELDFERAEELCEEEGDPHQEIDQLLEERPEAEERLEAGERLGESRLEGEVPEGETGAEGEQRLGGQSPTSGEVQPTEPPPTPPPQHTEEDLWLYLKEAVTSERPATVQQFLENLIGTLQHVPEEYLQPVVEANIKRATSPTLSTDGESPKALEEPVEKEESAALEGALTPEGDVVSPPEEAAAVEEESPEVPAELMEEESPCDDADGFSAVEAAA